MEICEHIIQKDQIVGIGPLMVQLSPDEAIQQFYNSRKLYFILHLKNQSTKIESDWFELGRGESISEEQKAAREAFTKWKSMYNDAKKGIIELIEL